MREEWKIIDEAPNYEVSNLGRIKTIKTGRIRKLTLTNAGYVQIGLFQNGKIIYRLVHRLVAKAFIPNPNNLNEVNHKDFNKQNNTVANLEWVDHRTNMMYNWKEPNPNKMMNEIMKAVKAVLNKYIEQ